MNGTQIYRNLHNKAISWIMQIFMQIIVNLKIIIVNRRKSSAELAFWSTRRSPVLNGT